MLVSERCLIIEGGAWLFGCGKKGKYDFQGRRPPPPSIEASRQFSFAGMFILVMGSNISLTVCSLTSTLKALRDK